MRAAALQRLQEAPWASGTRKRLGGDVEMAVSVAMKAGAVFPGGGDALAPAAAASVAARQAIFRNTLAASIRDIERKKA